MPKVKALEWKQTRHDVWVAVLVGYVIDDMGDQGTVDRYWATSIDRDYQAKFETLELAQSAADEHHAAAIWAQMEWEGE